MNDTQIEFHAAGRGFVEMRMTHRSHEPRVVYLFSYPEQGTMVGEPPRDVQNAAKLNEAVERLNIALAELSS